MSRSNYKRLGDHIREVNVRNRDLAVAELLGVSIQKCFIQSIANTIGTDMSTYKIVEQRQFAYGPVTSRNGDKVSIALLSETDKAIISQAYTVFEVIDKDELLPEYLMMWFRRAEFDRYARFKSHGSAREIFDWGELCNIQLPIPAIKIQREIVSEYEVLSRRIALNESLCDKLEQTAAALYRKTFIDNIDPQNLPRGWRMGAFNEIIEITSGKVPPYKNPINTEFYKYPIYGAGGIMGYSKDYLYDEELLVIGRVGSFGNINRVNSHCWLSDNTLIIKSNFIEYSYNILLNTDFDELNRGGVQGLITQTDIKNKIVILPPSEELIAFEIKSKQILTLYRLSRTENDKLFYVKELLLSKLATN